MAKHILVDDLMPPVPVMAMAAAVLAANLYSYSSKDEKYGKYALLGFMLLNAFAFATDPEKVVTDSFPDVKSGSAVMAFTVLLIEVVAMFSAGMALFILLRPGSASVLAFELVWFATVYRHATVYNAGPPMPALLLNGVAAALALFGVVAPPAAKGKDA
uniref:Uncharacterized protein n=1 Tax=Prasinoderma singulare TaxID=676789 RepID=A0A7S3FJQ0_9VIRI